MPQEQCLGFEPDCVELRDLHQRAHHPIRGDHQEGDEGSRSSVDHHALTILLALGVLLPSVAMIASIKGCRNQNLVAYLSYKQDTRLLFEVKCKSKNRSWHL